MTQEQPQEICIRNDEEEVSDYHEGSATSVTGGSAKIKEVPAYHEGSATSVTGGSAKINELSAYHEGSATNVTGGSAKSITPKPSIPRKKKQKTDLESSTEYLKHVEE